MFLSRFAVCQDVLNIFCDFVYSVSLLDSLLYSGSQKLWKSSLSREAYHELHDTLMKYVGQVLFFIFTDEDVLLRLN